MAVEFLAPDFIENNHPEAIQRRMMENLPPDIDNMPGGFPYDFTMPTALEKSNLIQFHLVRTIMLMFPMWAWGEWLDLHGSQVGITRKAPNRASGTITIEGNAGTALAKGFRFCTPATDTGPCLEFLLNEDVVIPDNGAATAEITAVLPGRASNVKSDAITLMAKPVRGISKIYNQADVTGGTDEEEDEAYLDRIMEKYGSEGASYIGNDADYRRWAREVSGIGDCIVMPTWNGPGTVKLVLVDSNGQPANEQLQEAVYNYIISPDDREKRLMPTGSAELTVAAADTRMIDYACSGLALDNSVSAELVESVFRERVLEYYAQAKMENIVRYNKIHCILTNIPGVMDFSNLLINGEEKNILLDPDEYPQTNQIDFVI